MRTIAIINQKGGCGKTTVSINLAAALAGLGHRTLLVDIDPQSHCALGLAVPDAQIKRSMVDILHAGLNGQIGLSDITWQIARNLDLAPSSLGMAALEQELAHTSDRDRRLMQVLATVQDDYDYCIVDCPPAIGMLTFNALRAADEVIIPVETGYFSMQGSFKQEATIEMLAQRVNHPVRFRVLATMYDVRTKLAREILSELRRHFGDKLLPVVINFNIKLKEAASFGQPITEYDPGSRGMQDFAKLVNWLVANPPRLAAAEQEASPPVLSRAAELVERARALSARAAALSSRLARSETGNTQSGSRQNTPAPETVDSNTGVHAAFGERVSAEVTTDVSADTRNSVSATHNAVADTDASSASHRLQPHVTSHVQTPAPPVSSRLPEIPRRRDPQPVGATVDGDRSAAAVSVSASASSDTLTPVAPAAPAPFHNDPRMRSLFGCRPTAQGLLFVQPARAGRRLFIAGDFNNWSASATPLTQNPDLGVCEACVDLPPGRYRYRLIVDGQWMKDPYNSHVEPNPFGEPANVVELKGTPAHAR